MDARHLSRELWRWYILLLIANELDLAYTYVGLSRGAFLEGNPWLGPLLLTWWPIAIKVICLAGLALGLLVILEAGLPRQPRVLPALRIATPGSPAVLILPLVNLLPSPSPCRLLTHSGRPCPTPP